MKIVQAVKYCLNYHEENSKKKYAQQLQIYSFKVANRIWPQKH
jgi:hypothetical protein